MKFTPLGIEGVWLFESPIYRDDRGLFREWFKSETIEEFTGRKFAVEQANVSLSSKGTLRGIHYSLAPKGQAKWITCVSGSIKDVVVDIRPNSTTFGNWIEVELSGDSGNAIFISEGLGHGFLALEDQTIVSYLISTSFSVTNEYEINPLDEAIGIDWSIDPASMKISEKDRTAPTLSMQLGNGKLPH
jgi:dTDP-4-dehydrorhamnose 3,5-epimerase